MLFLFCVHIRVHHTIKTRFSLFSFPVPIIHGLPLLQKHSSFTCNPPLHTHIQSIRLSKVITSRLQFILRRPKILISILPSPLFSRASNILPCLSLWTSDNPNGEKRGAKKNWRRFYDFFSACSFSIQLESYPHLLSSISLKEKL